MAKIDRKAAKRLTGATAFEFDSLDGYWHEAACSVKQRIADRFGFQPEKIILLEGSEKPEAACVAWPVYYFDQVSFQVCGQGYSTADDFTRIVMNDAYSSREGE